MTPREMAADELESILAAMRRIGMRVEAETLRAHIAALRARAEAAEADNAVLVDGLARRLVCEWRSSCGFTCDDWPNGGAINRCSACRTRDDLKNHPGAGYRAKVRAELLRELAEEHQQAAALAHSLDAVDEGARQEAYAHGLETQAAREEQG